MKRLWRGRLSDVETFPHPEHADADGLVAVGGDLSPQRLLLAYRSGIFPWYSARLPILWWSPDPRAVLELPAFHVSRSFQRVLDRRQFRVSFDRDFRGVIRGCADRPGGETWITPEMLTAYERLHTLGHAHSVEVWRGRKLVGGVYGVAIGGFFAAESMFCVETDMSKVALHHLVEVLRSSDFRLLDIQILSQHTRSLGGTEITRREYLRRLERAVELPRTLRAGGPELG